MSLSLVPFSTSCPSFPFMLLGYSPSSARSPTCRDPGSNQGPSDLQSDAPPPELSRLGKTWKVVDQFVSSSVKGTSAKDPGLVSGWRQPKQTEHRLQRRRATPDSDGALSKGRLPHQCATIFPLSLYIFLYISVVNFGTFRRGARKETG